MMNINTYTRAKVSWQFGCTVTVILKARSGLCNSLLTSKSAQTANNHLSQQWRQAVYAGEKIKMSE